MAYVTRWRTTTMIDLVTVSGLTIILVALVHGVSLEPLRIAIGVPAALFFPGYSFVAVLYPSRGVLNSIERIGMSIGFSIALIPILGLALNFTPWGLSQNAMLTTLVLWNLCMALTAWYRRLAVSPSERSGISWTTITTELQRLRRPTTLASYLLLMVGLAVLVGVTTWKLQQPIPSQAFTEFYILGPDGMADDYPTAMPVGQTQKVNGGVVNREGGDRIYHLVVLQEGVHINSVGPLELGHGRRWEGQMEVTPTIPAQGSSIEFHLYREPVMKPSYGLKLAVDITDR